MRTLLAALLATTFLPACSLPYRPPEIVEADATFPGLIDFVARAPTKSADVLLVHGMCTHDAAWADETVATLADQLAAQSPPGVPSPAVKAAAVPGIQIVPHDVTTSQGTIRFRALVWSPLITPIKQQLCYDQTGKSAICAGTPPYAYKRASLNAQIKDWLVDDCLPDALIYQGAAREQIQQRMQEAILAATQDSDPRAPLVVIAESLGSKILFDTLLRMSEEKDGKTAQAAMREVQRMAWLVMAANQIPLLHTAEQAIDPSLGTQGAQAMQAAPPDSLQRLLAKRRAPLADRSPPPPLTLVAFTDPNDLLSYTLLPERYREQGATVVNVLVSNARTYAGWLEDPVQAHVGYLGNPDVGRLVACGEPRSVLCR